MRQLPYPALRVVEAVVRLRSFSRAAEEMGMTQSAVSQHVRALEDWTGRRLLIRGRRASTATEDGELLAAAIAEGIGRIGAAIDHLQKKSRTTTTINIACPPGFAVNWLFPRLLNFDMDHPDIPVSVSTQPDDVLFETGRADVAIRYGTGGYSGLHAERLLGERVFPVCAPALIASGPRLDAAADLARHTLLADIHTTQKGEPPTWEFWAKETGTSLPKPARMRRFGQSNLTVQAALQGAGVALGREPLVIDALCSGRLMRPFPEIAVSRLFYWVVCPLRALDQPHIAEFVGWLRREAARQAPLPDLRREL
ncbi:MAG: LysR substrate-binding domain-containing protein [Paracoccaceae bacterium]